MDIWLAIVIAVVLAGVSGFVCFKFGMAYRQKVAEAEIGGAENKAKDIINEAKKKSEAKKREVLLEAKEEILKNKTELDKEIKERRAEISRQERRVLLKEESLDKKEEAAEKREQQLDDKVKELADKEQQLFVALDKQKIELERVAHMSAEEAKQELINAIHTEAVHEAAQRVQEIEEKAKEEANDKARNIIVGAIQRVASDQVTESTVSVVQLPSDDIKGRIIGREGRNIRVIENLTGVDLIIDDTPEAVILSGFDPVRREIARITLEKLIIDGRIHPTRIEEMVEKAKKEVEEIIRKAGNQATFDTNVYGLHPELVRILGKLKYRTSYGQNVLKHACEVSIISGLIAAELHADVKVARRAGLLHDIGKAIDHEVEGSHASIGADIAKKYKESPVIINTIAAHHGDVEPESVIAVIVQAADAISASRPGARRENIENYVKRLEQLEEIGNSFGGVEKTYAIQAGREIRIIVKPEEVNDSSMVVVAKEIVKKIEGEMEYPGQIKVNVIRETRAVEYAT
ncbi:MAG: ribonuclease Y [Clostridiales bacterium]|jgi:ribonuclease Y|nr:ribonuclease Y [Clostridiales bacterium]